jgi:hypothetical protein
MSAIWYECKVKYRKTDETGNQSDYRALSCGCDLYTEAESRINEEMAAYTSEEFKITNIKVADYAEIHPLKMQIVGLNLKFLCWPDESGKERKTSMYFFGTNQ